MPENTEKAREARLRRMATRQGYRLHKSRRRDPRAVDYGRWFICNARTNYLLTSEHGITLDEVEERLSQGEYLDFDALLAGL